MKNRRVRICLAVIMAAFCIMRGAPHSEYIAARSSDEENTITGTGISSDTVDEAVQADGESIEGYVSGEPSQGAETSQDPDEAETPGDTEITDLINTETPDNSGGEDIAIPQISPLPDAEGEDTFLTEDEEEVQENTEMTVFDQDNAEDYFGDMPESQELVEEIESGEMIALVPVALEAEFTESPIMAYAEGEETSLTALSSEQYEVMVSGYFQPQEMVKVEVTRHVKYIDEEGVQRIAPLYCLNASKAGVSDGTQFTDAAVEALNNTRIQKLLYYGYGGPGDICGKYDPTCEHIDWGLMRHRYLFTHCALSYEYARDTGRETVASLTHYGVFRFNDYIQKLSLPDRSGVEIGYYDENGNLQYGKNVSVGLEYYKSSQNAFLWLDGSGVSDFMVSGKMTVRDTGNCGNSVTISRSAQDIWQLGYWNSEEQYRADPENPSVIGIGETVSLNEGCIFIVAFPGELEQSAIITGKMSLKEVKFLLVDGDKISAGDNHQDFGACVYQGETGRISMEFIPASKPPKTEYGAIIVSKKIKTADIIWAHGDPTFIFVAEGTDLNGNPRKYEQAAAFTKENCPSNEDGYSMLTVLFDHVPLGTYKVYEKRVLRYYLADAVAVTSNVTITKGAAPAYGLNPCDIAYGTAILSDEMPEAELIFINEKSRYDGYSHTGYLKNQVEIV